MGLVAAIFQGLADFIEWASGQQHLHGRRPHPILVADVDVPAIPALPNEALGMEDAKNPTFGKDVVLPKDVAHSNVLRAMAKLPTIQEQWPIVESPYNFLMGVGGPHRWYAIIAELHIEVYSEVYFTTIEADKLVKKVPSNKHKKFKTFKDAIQWLQHEFVYNGNAHRDTPHKRELI